jgi:bifunctional non-homologous end joining protein LigD
MDKLAKYKSMRSKTKTPEPFSSDDVDLGHLVFVVQKHAAKALHYDFRLEVGGVMPSWAIPKGPSLDPSVKRLAMKTEDHPLDYRYFEGVIPEGEYGAGQVIIWDEGIYWPEVEKDGQRVKVKMKSEAERAADEGLKKGEIKFFLEGKRLKGSFALVKMKGFGKHDNAWLLIKHKDKFIRKGFEAGDVTTSIQSGKDLDAIAKLSLNR